MSDTKLGAVEETIDFLCPLPAARRVQHRLVEVPDDLGVLELHGQGGAPPRTPQARVLLRVVDDVLAGVRVPARAARLRGSERVAQGLAGERRVSQVVAVVFVHALEDAQHLLLAVGGQTLAELPAGHEACELLRVARGGVLADVLDVRQHVLDVALRCLRPRLAAGELHEVRIQCPRDARRGLAEEDEVALLPVDRVRGLRHARVWVLHASARGCAGRARPVLLGARSCVSLRCGPRSF